MLRKSSILLKGVNEFPGSPSFDFQSLEDNEFDSTSVITEKEEGWEKSETQNLKRGISPMSELESQMKAEEEFT